MKRLNLALAAMLILGVAAPAAAQDDAIHVPVPGGWTAVDEEYRYGPDNLWEYINGAAELFLSYGFRELIVQDIELGDQYLSVSVYDMGRPLAAFGVYEREKPADLKGLDGVGAAAVLQPPYRGLLLKNRFYVKAEVGGDDLTEDALRTVLVDIAAGLPGGDELPPALAALPVAGRVAGTVAFAGNAFLGLGDLSGCMHADYTLDDDTTYRLFTMRPSSRLLNNQTGHWVTETLDDSRLLMHREIPYSGVVVLLGDTEQMVGVSGFADRDQAVTVLMAVE